MPAQVYAGTVYEESWRQGFDAGFGAPDEDHPAPSPLDPDQQVVYAEGVLFGRDCAERGVEVPPSSPPEDGESVWSTVADVGIKSVEVGHTVYEFTKSVAAGSAGLFTLFLEAAIWGPKDRPFFDEAAAEALRGVRDALQQEGSVDQSIDLYMAACDQRNHGANKEDPLRRQGWWHGTVFITFDQALAQARTHEHRESTRVLHFQSAAPDTVEVIELDG